jgi:hypothetical protein
MAEPTERLVRCPDHPANEYEDVVDLAAHFQKMHGATVDAAVERAAECEEAAARAAKGESTPPAPKADVRVRVGGRGVSLAALRARPVVPATEPAQPPPHPIRRRRPASGWAADRYPWTS